MRQGRRKYAYRKRTMLRIYFGRPCDSFHPECCNCIAWRRHNSTWRWQHTKEGIAEYRATT